MKVKQLGERFGELKLRNSRYSEILEVVESELIDCMTARERIRYSKGFCEKTGENRLFEILGLV